jgi:hypothetical protein
MSLLNIFCDLCKTTVEFEQCDAELELIIHEMFETLINELKIGEHGKDELMHVLKIYKNVLVHI